MTAMTERRVIYVDVGDMPPAQVREYLEQIKNEIRRTRVESPPSRWQTVIYYIAEALGALRFWS